MTMPFAEPDALAPATLRAHLQQCSLTSGFLHRMHCASEAAGAFLAPRLVSVLVVVALLVGGILSMLVAPQ
jgi:hypothetical protein